MTITFQYTPENLQQAYELHLKKFSPFGGRVMMLLGVLIIWAGLILMLIYHKQGIQMPYVIFIALGLLVLVFNYIYQKNIGKRMHQSLSEFHRPFQIDINDSHVMLHLNEIETVYEWDRFSKAVITEKQTLLYFNDKLFYYFPSTNFEANDYNNFCSLVRKMIAIQK